MIVCALSDIFFLILKLGKNHSFSQYLVDGEKWMDKILIYHELQIQPVNLLWSFIIRQMAWGLKLSQTCPASPHPSRDSA